MLHLFPSLKLLFIKFLLECLLIRNHLIIFCENHLNVALGAYAHFNVAMKSVGTVTHLWCFVKQPENLNPNS